MHRIFAKLSAAIVAGAGALFVLCVVRDTFLGFDYAGGHVAWTADSGILWTQLALSACGGLIAAVCVRRILRDEDSIAHTIEWTGVAAAGIGALSLAVAQVGLIVPAPTYSFLRYEFIYAITGILGVIVGGLTAATCAAETGDLDTGA